MFQFLKKISFGNKIRALLGKKIDEETLENLEKLFYEADLGIERTEMLTETVRNVYKESPKTSPEEILSIVKDTLVKELSEVSPFSFQPQSPHVILIVGVNGNGKTTSLAKLAHYFKRQNKSVLMVAGDTFRAAAVEQLERWSLTIDVPLVKGLPKGDAAAVVYDAITAGKARHHDVILVDTAGRLHTKNHLMQELQKIYRVSDKALPGAPHETLLVLDATIGQNAIEQARAFHAVSPLTSLMLTKLDGTAKGGSIFSIQKTLKVPIKYIGTGEKIEDLSLFDPEAFVSGLLV